MSNQLKITIVGLGEMGQMLCELAPINNCELIATVDPLSPQASFSKLEQIPSDTQVIIDFSAPLTAVDNLRFYCEKNIQAVVGTTGWYDRYDEVRALVEQHNAKLICASNFAIGVHAFFKIVESASKLLNSREEFDIWGHELHHTNKIDSPSGTMHSIADIIKKNIDRKNKVVFDRVSAKLNSDQFHFGSVRGGKANFEHTISFGSSDETIELKHTAKDRTPYAQGAFEAAHWLTDQQPGLYSVNDLIEHIFKG